MATAQRSSGIKVADLSNTQIAQWMQLAGLSPGGTPSSQAIQYYRDHPDELTLGGQWVNAGGRPQWQPGLPVEQLLNQTGSNAAAQQAAAQGAGGYSGYYGSATGGGSAGGMGGAGGVPAGGNVSMATTSASQFPMAMFQGGYTPSSADVAEWQRWYGANQGKTILVNGQAKTIGQDIQPGDLYNAFQSGQASFGQYQQEGPQIAPQQIGGPGQQQPEQAALQQLAQIDPTTEALRQGLAQSYLTQLQGGGRPTNEQLQGYLQQFQQIDPQTYAAMQAMGGQYQNLIKQQQAATGQIQANLPQYQQQINQALSYLPQYQQAVNQAQANLAPYQQDVTRMNQLAALGTQLDPETLREITQATRQGQQARGNIYGTPQLVQEAMTRGQAGMQIQQQREQMLQAALGAQQGGMSSLYGALGQQQQGLGGVQSALGGQQNAYAQYLNSLAAQQGGLGAYQGYLTSGATPGGLALNLYNQQMGNIRANQAAALGYLGSGTTPYQAATGYINQAQQNAANAASQTSYNPQGPSSYYTGAGTSSFPSYGLSTSQNALNYYQGMNQAQMQNYAYGQAYGGQQGTNWGNVGSGALSGAASGALAGSAIPGVGTVLGGAIGALGGAAKGYFS